MAYVIYNKETTRLMVTKRFKSEGAAKAHLTRAAKKAARKAEVNEIFNRLDKPGVSFSELMDGLMAEGCTKREAYNARRTTEEFNRDEWAIAEAREFFDNIEKTVVVKNLMTGADVEQSINTPRSCDVSSELYWSM